MQQRTFFVTDKEELSSVINEIGNSKEYKTASDRLLVIYSNFMSRSETKSYVDIIKSKLPQIKISGISVITSTDKWDKRGLTLSFCLFTDSKADIFAYKCSEYNENEIIEEFSKVLGNIEDPRAVIFFPGSLYRDATKVLERITEKYTNICFFGALAANGMRYIDEKGFSNNFRAIFNAYEDSQEMIPYYITEEPESDGFLFTVLSGKKLQMTAKYLLGWHPLGKDMYVTKRRSDNIGNAIISEIDNRPAIEIYKKYLNVDPDEYFMANVCEFPMTIHRGHSIIARVPSTYGEDGELLFSGDIRDNEAIRLSYANPEELIKGSEIAALELSEFKPDAVFMIVCTNRFQFLRYKNVNEISFFNKITPDLALCYGGYEVLKLNNCGGVLNSALVAVGLKESDEIGIIDPDVNMEEAQVKHEGAIPFHQRLLTFIEASTRDLEEALDDAKRANNSKSVFLSNMSHEIRTPINAVLGMDEMILRESMDENILKYAEDIRSAGNSLLGLVNDILDFSKIEAGKMEIIPVEYEVASVLNDLINMIRKKAEDKGLKLVVKMDPTIPHLLYGDEIRIKQIVTNILTNAVKYTEKGSVTLSITCKGCSSSDEILIGFSVKDTGIGMKKEDLAKLYNAFERIDEKRNRTIEGTGLGMNITKNLLNMMGSDLVVESVYGEGSTFSFEILQKVVDDVPIGDFEDALKRSIAARKKYHESFTAPNARILVVDDTAMNLTVIEGLLKRTLVRIDTATSGFECLEKLKENSYDIVFLDHRMPEMDGIETLERIQKEKLIKDDSTPVIALTANAVSGSREFYLSKGFDDYISKPIDPFTLEAIILSHFLPKGLAIVSNDDNFQDSDKNYENSAYGNASEDEPDVNKSLEFLSNIKGLNVLKGVKNCGGEENYIKALTAYLDAASDNLESIQKHFDTKDIDNYTIKVHALKSSSKIIGALDIGNLAKELEDAGNANDIETINSKTKVLLSKYKDLIQSIKLPGDDLDKDSEGKEEISLEKLSEAYNTILEITQMFDYDSLTMVMDSLKEYRIPDGQKIRYDKLKEAVRKADWDEIGKICKEQEDA